MGTARIAKMTLRVLLVTWVGISVPVSALAEDISTGSEAVDQALRRVLRRREPLARRLGWAAEALRQGRPGDVEAALEAGTSLLESAPRTGLWLLIQARDAAFLPDADLEAAQVEVACLREEEAAPPERRALLAAAAFLLGDRRPAVAEDLLATWPPAPVVRAVLERDLLLPSAKRQDILDAADPARVRQVLRLLLPVLEALDRAERDDPRVAHAGMDALVALGAPAVVPLVELVERGTQGLRPGEGPRAVRAAVVLGALGDARAGPALQGALLASDGWLKAAAATALGDLGEAGAIPALCRHIFYRGDIQRPRDQWEYPGAQQTTVAAAAWPTIEYYVADVAAADALLRLGVPGAGGYLVDQKLDPARARFRVRVLQDSVDALRRAFGDESPVEAYNPDAGLENRRQAFLDLARWWHERPAGLASRFPALDENDAGWRRAAWRLVERLRGRSIMELQIAHETAALVGRPLTPVLLEVLAATKSKILRVEIARALGAVQDPRAVEALLRLLASDATIVQAMAAESLGAYLDAPEVKRVLLAALGNDEPQIAVAAMKGLVRAAPGTDMKQALLTHGYEDFQARFGTEDGEFERAETVALLVQDGARHWPPIEAGLRHEQRYVRTAWWDLLRRALRLRPALYDPIAVPGTPDWSPIDSEVVLEALRRRRGAR